MTFLPCPCVKFIIYGHQNYLVFNCFIYTLLCVTPFSILSEICIY